MTDREFVVVGTTVWAGLTAAWALSAGLAFGMAFCDWLGGRDPMLIGFLVIAGVCQVVLVAAGLWRVNRELRTLAVMA